MRQLPLAALGAIALFAICGCRVSSMPSLDAETDPNRTFDSRGAEDEGRFGRSARALTDKHDDTGLGVEHGDLPGGVGGQRDGPDQLL